MKEQPFSRCASILSPALSRTILFGLLLAAATRPCSGNGSKDLTKPAKAETKLADDFDMSKIKTIRMPEKPSESRYPVKARIHGGICSGLKALGYALEFDSSTEWPESEAHALLSVKWRKGETQIASAKKMGFDTGNDAENYSLLVSLRLKVKDGKTTKTACSMKCKMWHKFVLSKRQKSNRSGDYIITTWPVDQFGEGPNNLEKACMEMPSTLIQGLRVKKPSR